MSAHFEQAMSDWRECRAEFDDVLLSAYDRAAEACSDALVNALGKRRGIDPLSLFMGNSARARCYASEELIEWWETHPRMPFVEFERQWMQMRDETAAHDNARRAQRETDEWWASQ